MKTSIVMTILLFFWIALEASANAATPPLQEARVVQTYTVQLDDRLPHLAEKYFQSPQFWPAIVTATNAPAAEDPTIAPIETPQVILPGHRLVIPSPVEATQILAENRDVNQILVPPTDSAPLTAAWLADFSTYVDQTRRHFDIPGVALVVVGHNQILLAQGFGVRELGQSDPVTPQTIFAIGSTTKALNSTLVATLVDDGLLDWDQPVVEIWPDFELADPTTTAQIRVRDLLNMGSGLPRADLAWSGLGLTAEQTMTSLVDIPVVAPPGQRYQYNNQLVATGGFVAALAAGQPYGNLEEGYEALLQARVLAPIGMSSASMSPLDPQSTANQATPHDFTLAGEVLPTYHHVETGIAPAGAVTANVIDLGRFLIAQLNQGVSQTGARVVSAQNLSETRRPQTKITQNLSYGMGWFIEEYEGVQLIWHDGDLLGFKSLLLMVPEADVGLALMTNRTISYGFSNSVRYRLVEQLYNLETEAGDDYKTQWDNFIAALPNIRAPLAETISIEAASPYLGQYETGWQVERREDGTLWAIRGPYQWQLLAAGQGKFVINNGLGITSEIKFERNEIGRMKMVIMLSTGEVGEYLKN